MGEGKGRDSRIGATLICWLVPDKVSAWGHPSRGIFSEQLWFSHGLVQCHSCPTSALTAARGNLSYVS